MFHVWNLRRGSVRLARIGRPRRASAHARRDGAPRARTTRALPFARTARGSRPPAAQHRGPVAGRPPADVQRGRLGLDRLQRRDLQPRRAAPRAGGARPPLPLATDTETLLHLYEEHGEDDAAAAARHVRLRHLGRAPERLFVARDRVGIKPFYYTVADGRFLFGSEIKALRRTRRWTSTWIRVALYHYLTFMTTPAPRRCSATSQQAAGRALLTLDGRGDVSCPPLVGRGRRAAADPPRCSRRGRVRRAGCALLEEAVEERLMADVPFGVLLSGGVDSTAITALVRGLHTGPLRTFSVGFTDAPEHDELGHARRVARAFGTEHHEVVIDPTTCSATSRS
jgi:asparagine synthase (glutamine-hydrolysing)